MNRVTVMIGAMKPMTRGHYTLITNAVEDTKCPAGEEPANETYVLMSMQDRIKKGQFPISGETALSSLANIYFTNDNMMIFGKGKFVKLVFCHSSKFAIENPDRLAEMKKIIQNIKGVLAERGLTNISTQIEEVSSGPPNYLISLSEQRPESKFVLYTGADDLKVYGYMNKYPNIELAGFERFEGGLSGTEMRRGFQTDKDTEDFDAERFASGFPEGVDVDAIRRHYRSAAGLDPLKESFKRRERGTKEYGSYLEDVMNELQHIKKEYASRTKEGSRYRKEANIIQNSIRELNRLKKDHERKFEDDQMLSERLVRKATGYDDYEEKDETFNRDSVRDFFNKFK